MKTKILLVLICSVPLLLFLNAWQVFKFESAKSEVISLEHSQQEWLEKNKKMIVGIEVLSSPTRLDSLADERPDLFKAADRPVLRIEIGGEDD